MAVENNDDDLFPTRYVLLAEDYQLETFEPRRLSRNFKISSFAVGLLVGFLVQLTTLAANVVIWEVWGDDLVNSSRKKIVAFSLLWSFVTSAMAIITLGFIRALMSSFFRSLPVDGRMYHLMEKIHDEMVECMEILFVIGALVGVSLAWIVTDMLLGMHPQINFSLTTLSVALLWCKAVFWFRSRSEEGLDCDSEIVEGCLFLSPTDEPIMVV